MIKRKYHSKIPYIVAIAGSAANYPPRMERRTSKDDKSGYQRLILSKKIRSRMERWMIHWVRIYRTDVKPTKYRHFKNVPPMKPPFTPNLDIGNEYVTFGWNKT
jgi:hypothetical protein